MTDEVAPEKSATVFFTGLPYLTADNSGQANTLRDELVKDEPLPSISMPEWQTIPDIPNGDIVPVKVPENLVPKPTDVTVGYGTLSGDGAFDIFMQAIKAQLGDMKDAGTLNQGQITTVLTQVIPSVLQQAVEFSLQAPTIAAQSAATYAQAQASYWASVGAREQAYAVQAQAYSARIDAQVRLAELQLSITNVGLTKMRILESNEQCNLLKLQALIQQAQIRDELPDGPITGSIGRDNKLKDQQILNMQKDIDVKNEQIRLYVYQERAYDLDGKIKVASIWSANYQTLIANNTLDTVPDVLNIHRTNDVFTDLLNASGMNGHDGIDGPNANGNP